VDGTDHIIKLGKIRSPKDTKQHSAEESPNEAFKRLLWGKLNKWGTTDGDPPDIGKNIVANDEGCWNPKPDEAFEDIIHNEVTESGVLTKITDVKCGIVPRNHNEKQTHMNPAKEAKLLLKISLLKRHDKAHEADRIKREANNTMVGSERKQLSVSENDMLRI
jgi:hypothetical protein